LCQGTTLALARANVNERWLRSRAEGLGWERLKEAAPVLIAAIIVP